MTVHIPFLFAVALAGIAALVGQKLVQGTDFLKRGFVPEPLLGGLLFAVIIFLLRVSDMMTLEIPKSGPSVDFLVALLTTNMGLHITPKIFRNGAKLFLLFLGSAFVLGLVQFTLVLPVALGEPYPIHTAILAGPLSFVGAPYNLNPPSQTAPINQYFQQAYPNLKELAQGIMMIGVVSSILGASFFSRKFFRMAGKEPPNPSPVKKTPDMPLGKLSTGITSLIVLIFSLISVAFALQQLILQHVSWMKNDYLPVIVASFLLGALFRLSFSWLSEKDKFPEKALTVLLLGPTMSLVLAYAVMSVPLHLLQLLSPRLFFAALIAVTCSAVFSWFAFRLFARKTDKYYAAVIATAFLVLTTGWGPMAMSFLRRFIDEEGPVEPMPVIMPLNAFFLFPWLAVLLTTALLHLFGQV